jgi:DNA helicase-2/ATP-dependent DNA helicase PcrA
MKSSENKLNKQQLQAVKHGEGPLLIIAGAGTGKTTVITERIKHLIVNDLAKPEEILALTFTEKGAREMEERIDVALPLGYGEMWISTFHSFCDRILKESGIEIGLSPNYKLMTQAQAIDLIKKNLFDFNLEYFRPLGNPNKFIDGLLQHFSRLQDECITPEDYLEYSNKYTNEEVLEIAKIKELSNAYKFYTNLKIENNVLDFGDLITYTNKLFIDRPNVLKRYQENFKYILVDEFQDTNFAQNELVNLLAKKYRNITIVGDDNQSIYRFRGAAISNIIQFRKTYPDSKVVTLNENYRSTQTILDGAYKLIKHNDPDTLEYQLKISKELQSKVKHKENKIEFINTSNSQEEAEELANKIIELTSKGKGHEYKDIAVLVRANNHADAFIREFERKEISHQFLGPSKLFEKEEVVDLITYLKVLVNPEDSVSMYRLLDSDVFELSSLELIKISSQAKKNSQSIFEVITELKNEIQSKDYEKIVNLLQLIDKHLKIIKKETAGHILYDYIKEVGIYKKIVEDNDDSKAKNIAKFFEKIKAYEEENKDAGVVAVCNYIDLLIEVGEGPNVTDGDWQENNAVNILTVHSSKGLEFPVVFLVNLVNERFPSRERHEQIPIPEELIKEVLPKGDCHVQEERRLFYVGMTRAKERLYLTAASYYGDGKREKKVSPFVLEALGEEAQKEKKIINNKSLLSLEQTKKEGPIIKDKQHIKINYLSVSQIETFKTCPLHYKLKYIYKLQTPPSASISFGVSVHNTLKEFFEIEKKKANKNSILNIYKENWIEEGYLNKKHKEEFYKKGETYLLGFLKNGYNPKIKTVSLEEKFTLKINNDLRSSLAIKIGGTIDRVDDLGSGRYEIIDYKTGANIPSQKEVDKDMQLSFYALAVSTLYKVRPEDIKLSLYYLDTQEKITTSRTKEDLERLKDEILDIKEEIENSDFRCNNSYFCLQGCEYQMFCKGHSN